MSKTCFLYVAATALTVVPVSVFALPQVTFSDPYNIPFSYTFGQTLSGGIFTPLNVTINNVASGFVPGFNTQDSRLGNLAGLPIARDASAVLRAQAAITTFVNSNCNTSSPCRSVTIDQTANLAVANNQTGTSLSSGSLKFFNLAELPPFQRRTTTNDFSTSQVVRSGLGEVSKDIKPGTYDFDVSLNIQSPSNPRREYTSVSGQITGSISGIVNTTVEVAKFGANRQSFLDLSASLGNLSTAISATTFATNDLGNLADQVISGGVNSKNALAFIWSAVNLGTSIGILPKNDTSEYVRQYSKALINTVQLFEAAKNVTFGTPADKAAGLAQLTRLNIGAVSSFLKVGSIVLELIANDPPNADFKSLTDLRPQINGLLATISDALTNPELSTLANEFKATITSAKFTANLLGGLEAYERYQGALIARDFDLARAQLELAESYMADLQLASPSLAAALAALEGENTISHLSEAEIANLRSVISRLLAKLNSDPALQNELLGFTLLTKPEELQVAFSQGTSLITSFLGASDSNYDTVTNRLLTAGLFLAERPGGNVEIDNGSGSTAVPEPISIIMILSSLIATYCARRYIPKLE